MHLVDAEYGGKAERAEMKALAGGASRAKAEKVEQKVLRRKGGSRR